MANNNKALSAAGLAKKDEFYTQLVDIENELRHYKQHFKGKVFSATAMIHTRVTFSNTSLSTSITWG